MKLYQLANDPEIYRDHALSWIVVSDDAEEELSQPFKTKEEAESALKVLETIRLYEAGYAINSIVAILNKGNTQ
jgi:hypothetical protein